MLRCLVQVEPFCCLLSSLKHHLFLVSYFIWSSLLVINDRRGWGGWDPIVPLSLDTLNCANVRFVSGVCEGTVKGHACVTLLHLHSLFHLTSHWPASPLKLTLAKSFFVLFVGHQAKCLLLKDSTSHLWLIGDPEFHPIFKLWAI